MEPTSIRFPYFGMSMTFTDLVEEIRHRPVDERLELRDILDKDLIAERRQQIHHNHIETMEELKHGKLVFSSNVDELMGQLKEE